MKFTTTLPRYRALVSRLDAHTSDGERHQTSLLLTEYLRGALPDRSALGAFLACSKTAHRTNVLDHLAIELRRTEFLLTRAHTGLSYHFLEPTVPDEVARLAGGGQRANELGAWMLEDVRQVVASLAELADRHGWVPFNEASKIT